MLVYVYKLLGLCQVYRYYTLYTCSTVKHPQLHSYTKHRPCPQINQGHLTEPIMKVWEPFYVDLPSLGLQQRQPTQHGCLPSLLGGRDKGIEKVYIEETNVLYLLGRLEQPRQSKNLLHRHDKPNEPTKKGPLLYVLFESPFNSV